MFFKKKILKYLWLTELDMFYDVNGRLRLIINQTRPCSVFISIKALEEMGGCATHSSVACHKQIARLQRQFRRFVETNLTGLCIWLVWIYLARDK